MSPRTALSSPQVVKGKTLGWMGGVNMRDAINQLAANEARKMENGILDDRGAFGKRKGSTSHGTFGVGGDRGISDYTFYRGTAAPHVLLQTSAGKLYYTADASAGAIVWTQIATGLSGTAPFSFETFNGKCYFSNGVDAYASWDGTTYTTYGAAPKGKFLCLWKDTMWVSGVTGLADRVYASSPGDAETFPGASWVDIAKGDGDATTALASDGQFLIVGKRERTFTIYDPVTFANRVVDFEKGMESHFAIEQFEGIIYFLSRRGICLYYGDQPSRIISEKIDPLFSQDLLALDQLWQARAIAFNNRILFNLAEVGETKNTLQLEYYPRLSPFNAFGTRNAGMGPWAFQRMPVQCFARVRSGASDTLYAAHNAANKYLKLYDDIGTDDGAAFTATLETGALDMGEELNTKYLRGLRVLCSGKFNLYILRDFGIDLYRTVLVDAGAVTDTWSLADLWGTGTWGPDSPVKDIKKTNLDAFARYFTFRFQDSGETGIGIRPVYVGNTQKSLVVGEWAIYGLAYKATVLGERS